LLHSFNHVFNCHAVCACVGIQPAPQQYNLPPTTRQMCVCVRACVGIQPCVPEASRQGHINLRVYQSACVSICVRINLRAYQSACVSICVCINLRVSIFAQDMHVLSSRQEAPPRQPRHCWPHFTPAQNDDITSYTESYTSLFAQHTPSARAAASVLFLPRSCPALSHARRSVI